MKRKIAFTVLSAAIVLGSASRFWQDRSDLGRGCKLKPEVQRRLRRPAAGLASSHSAYASTTKHKLKVPHEQTRPLEAKQGGRVPRADLLHAVVRLTTFSPRGEGAACAPPPLPAFMPVARRTYRRRAQWNEHELIGPAMSSMEWVRASMVVARPGLRRGSADVAATRRPAHRSAMLRGREPFRRAVRLRLQGQGDRCRDRSALKLSASWAAARPITRDRAHARCAPRPAVAS